MTPGATHTRFEHCIGTAHLAKKFLETLIANHPTLYKKEDADRAVLVATLAGLLHDVGHGPYSHAFDECIVTIDVELNGKKEKWSHELASEYLFRHITELPHINGLLSQSEINRVKALIRGEAD